MALCLLCYSSELSYPFCKKLMAQTDLNGHRGFNPFLPQVGRWEMFFYWRGRERETVENHLFPALLCSTVLSSGSAEDLSHSSLQKCWWQVSSLKYQALKQFPDGTSLSFSRLMVNMTPGAWPRAFDRTHQSFAASLVGTPLSHETFSEQSLLCALCTSSMLCLWLELVLNCLVPLQPQQKWMKSSETGTGNPSWHFKAIFPCWAEFPEQREMVVVSRTHFPLRHGDGIWLPEDNPPLPPGEHRDQQHQVLSGLVMLPLLPPLPLSYMRRALLLCSKNGPDQGFHCYSCHSRVH